MGRWNRGCGQYSDGISADVLVPDTATAEDLRNDLGAANAAIGMQALWT